MFDLFVVILQFDSVHIVCRLRIQPYVYSFVITCLHEHTMNHVVVDGTFIYCIPCSIAFDGYTIII